MDPLQFNQLSEQLIVRCIRDGRRIKHVVAVVVGLDVAAERLRDIEAHNYRNYVLDAPRSEEHTSELQSQSNLVCPLLLEKKKSGNSVAPPLYACTRDR